MLACQNDLLACKCFSSSHVQPARSSPVHWWFFFPMHSEINQTVFIKFVEAFTQTSKMTLHTVYLEDYIFSDCYKPSQTIIQ
jgi:hypothetical protein